MIKIGYTSDIKQRMKDLNTAIPFPISVELLLNGDRKEETRLHLLFKKYRAKGEWFYFSDEISDYIKMCKETKIAIESALEVPSEIVKMKRVISFKNRPYSVRSLRKNKKMSQVDLAKILNTSQSAIAQMETGIRGIGKHMAQKLSKIFEVEYYLIMTDSMEHTVEEDTI